MTAWYRLRGATESPTFTTWAPAALSSVPSEISGLVRQVTTASTTTVDPSMSLSTRTIDPSRISSTVVH